MKYLVFTLLCSLSITLFAGENIVRNSGFENIYRKGSEILPKKWLKSFQAYNRQPNHHKGIKNYKIFLDPNNPYQGKYSACIHVRSQPVFQARFVQHKVPVKAGQLYELNFAYRTQNIKGKAFLMLTGCRLEYFETHVIRSNKWRRMKRYFKPGGAGFISCWVQSNSVGKIWYDDIIIKKITEEKKQPNISIELQGKPGAQLFYSDTKERNLNVKLNINLAGHDPKLLAYDMKVYKINGLAAHRTINAIHMFSKNLVNLSQNEITIPTKKLKQGQYQLEVALLNKKSLTYLAVSKQNFYIIPDVEPKNENIFVKVDGKPFLGLGMYNVNSRDHYFKELADNGFNFVHSYSFQSEKSIESMLQYLDLAQRYKLKVMLNLPRKALRNSDSKRIKEIILKTGKHPALLAYYEDEMIQGGKATKEFIAKVYDMIKKYSDNKLFIVEDHVGGKYGVNPSKIDIAMKCGYWISEDQKRLEHLVKNVKRLRVNSDNIPFWMAGQAYARPNSTYPNNQQQRFFAYSSILNGVTGIGYFTHHSGRLRHARKDAAHWERLKKVVKELSIMSPVFTSNEDIPEGFELPEELKKYCITKYHDSRIYLVIVNASLKEMTMNLEPYSEFKINEVTFKNGAKNSVDLEGSQEIKLNLMDVKIMTFEHK